MDINNKQTDGEREHVLVGISSAPSNAKIIQTASKMSKAFKGAFTALYVKTPKADSMSVENRERLEKNIRLAQTLGATVITVYGEDVSFQIAEYARLSGVTKIVMGRSAVNKKRLIGKPTLADQLIAIAPNVDIHIIPDGASKISEQKSKILDRDRIRSVAKDMLITLAILLLASALGYVFSLLGFTEANIITVYIIGVLITSVITNSKTCWVFSSIASVLVFNFFFTVPRFSLLAYEKGYPVTFVIMLIASLITGILAGKMKEQAKQSSKVAFRTKLLFDANQLIQKAKDDEEILSVTAKQLNKLLKKDVLVYKLNGEVSEYAFDENKGCMVAQNCQEISEWVIKNKQKAGKGTEQFSNNAYAYLPIDTVQGVYGVIAIYIGERSIDTFDYSVTQSIVGECALALERNQTAREKELASVLAKNEQLRANILRAISHDLRTPLTSISGNASNLFYNENIFDKDTKLGIYKDIYEDSVYLINLVENLLSVSRLEEGRMNIDVTTDIVSEVVGEAVKRLQNRVGSRKIVVEQTDEILLAKMDARLIVQVIINLLDNALKYTPEGSTIRVKTGKEEGQVFISVIDDGEGVPDSQKQQVFDMFYTGTKKVADGKRSLGLGLALCKSIITAHGGKIGVTDNQPKGAVFKFTLPIGEVEIDE